MGDKEDDDEEEEDEEDVDDDGDGGDRGRFVFDDGDYAKLSMMMLMRIREKGNTAVEDAVDEI